jgi:hypothetical protein
MWRQQVLDMRGQARALFIRRQANSVIQDCEHWTHKVADASLYQLKGYRYEAQTATEQRILDAAIGKAKAAKTAQQR